MANPKKENKKATVVKHKTSLKHKATSKHHRRSKAAHFRNYSDDMIKAVNLLKEEGWVTGCLLGDMLFDTLATTQPTNRTATTVEATNNPCSTQSKNQVFQQPACLEKSASSDASDSENDFELSKLLEKSMDKLWIK